MFRQLTLSRTSLTEGSPLEEGGCAELQSATALQLCGRMGPRSLSLVSECSPSPALAAPLLSDLSPLGEAAVGPGSGGGAGGSGLQECLWSPDNHFGMC